MLTILQFDAASASLLDRLLADERLPTLAALREHGLEVGGVGDDVPDRPSRQVGRQGRLLRRDGADEGHEIRTGPAPQLDEMAQSSVGPGR